MIKKITSGTQGTFFILNSEFLFEKNYNMIYSKRHLHFVFDLFLCVSLSPCLQTLRILHFFKGTLGVIPWVPDAFHARFPVSVKSGLRPTKWSSPTRAKCVTRAHYGQSDMSCLRCLIVSKSLPSKISYPRD